MPCCRCCVAGFSRFRSTVVLWLFVSPLSTLSCPNPLPLLLAVFFPFFTLCTKRDQLKAKISPKYHHCRRSDWDELYCLSRIGSMGVLPPGPVGLGSGCCGRNEFRPRSVAVCAKHQASLSSITPKPNRRAGIDSLTRESYRKNPCCRRMWAEFDLKDGCSHSTETPLLSLEGAKLDRATEWGLPGEKRERSLWGGEREQGSWDLSLGAN